MLRCAESFRTRPSLRFLFVVAVKDAQRRCASRLDKFYSFDGPNGPVTLGDLFGDRMQLIVRDAAARLPGLHQAFRRNDHHGDSPP